MKLTILPGRIMGEITAVPSKSYLHRQLICAAFSDKDTLIACRETEAEDVNATIECLSALGAIIGKNEEGFMVMPIDRNNIPSGEESPVIFPCGECGSTLRFMLPIACALGIRGAFTMHGNLPNRPLKPLDEQLENHGIHLWRDTPDVLNCAGKLFPADDYTIPGDISSQFISGLLMALPLLDGQSNLTVSGTVESGGYIEMTLEVMDSFGRKPEVNSDYYMSGQNARFDTRAQKQYVIYGTGGYIGPGRVETEGDWSNSAFWMCAGAMPRGNVKIRGLKKDSTQGDREIYSILCKMGANVINEGDRISVSEDRRYSMEIDARAIPDLIPVIAAVAAVGSGKTLITNASRLRIKESDRLTTTKDTLQALGASIQETADGLSIDGVNHLRGGTVDAHGDHRIAMMAAIASTACSAMPVTINGAQAVNKSYPAFWDDLRLLGKKVIEE